MFVAVACEFLNEDHKKAVVELLNIFRFRKVHENLYESLSIGEKSMSRLKREIDKVTDSYDSFSFFQYPLNNTLIITELKAKKWRRRIVKLPDEENIDVE